MQNMIVIIKNFLDEPTDVFQQSHVLAMTYALCSRSKSTAGRSVL